MSRFNHEVVRDVDKANDVLAYAGILLVVLTFELLLFRPDLAIWPLLAVGASAAISTGMLIRESFNG